MVTQGVSGSVQDKGSMRQYLPYLEQSFKHAMQDLGIENLPKLREYLYSGRLRFELQFHTPESWAFKSESHELYEIFRAEMDPEKRTDAWTRQAALARLARADENGRGGGRRRLRGRRRSWGRCWDRRCSMRSC